jgi:hypothetical protein
MTEKIENRCNPDEKMEQREDSFEEESTNTIQTDTPETEPTNSLVYGKTEPTNSLVYGKTLKKKC